jgi:hypothetical protein
MKAVKYDSALCLRASPLVIALIKEAAHRRGTKPSEWIRNACHLALNVEGFDVTKIQERD